MKIVGDMEKRAEKTLSDNRDKLDRLAEELLEKETLSRVGVDKVLQHDRPN